MKKYLNLIYLIITIITNYFGIILLKYTLNDFSIFEFNILSFGNIILLLSLFLSIIFLILLNQKKANVFKQNLRAFFIIMLFAIISFILILLVINQNIPITNEYLWGYPFNRVLLTFLFVINYWLLLYLLFVSILLSFYKLLYVYLKSLVYSTLFITFLLIISFLYSITFTVNKFSNNNYYDYGVILGAAVWKGNKPSPILEGRILKGYELYKKRIIKKILVTGGSAPGELTESQVSYNRLISFGVKKEDILIEKKTSATIEQIKYIKNNLILNGNEKIIIISDQFHLQRVMEICKFFNIKVQGIPSDTKYLFKKLLYYRIRESVALMLFWLFAI